VIEDPNGLAYSTTYQYDELDNLKLVTQAAQTRTFVYDSLSQLRSATNPESNTVQYSYDPNGNLDTRTDARGTLTTYAYDNLDRLTGKTYTIAGSTTSTPNVTYTYDTLAPSCNSKGRLTSVASSASTANVGCYDTMGRPTQSTQTTGGNNYAFSYGYDLSGNLVSQTYPSGKIISTAIDPAGRIKTLQRQGGVYYAGDATNSIKYTPHGGMMQAKLGNGLWEQTRFNKRLQMNHTGIGQDVDLLTSAFLTLAKSNRLLLGNCFNANIDPPGCAGVSTNNNGNVLRHLIQVADPLNPLNPPILNLTQNFTTYDALNRLGSAAESGGSNPWSQTYGHDQYGNHWVSAGANYGNTPALTPTSSNNFEASNRLSIPAGYDYSGNLTTDVTGRTFTYDAENRQTGYNAGIASLNATYEYDGDGNRAKQVQNGVTTFFVYDVRGRLAAEYSTQALSETGTRYLTADHLGSTRIVTDTAGAVLTRHDYLPFGDQISSSLGGRSGIAGYVTGSTIRQKFTGKERDQESSLDYFGARYFSSPQARFTNADPKTIPSAFGNPQAWNKYAYSLNNPLRYTDPDGRSPQEGAGSIQDRDVQDYLAGRVNAEQFNERIQARAAGAAAGIAAVTGFFYPEVLAGGSAALQRLGPSLTRLATLFNSLVDKIGTGSLGRDKGLDVAKFASDAGFKEGVLVVENMIAGQLGSGGSVGINVRAVGNAIQVGVPMIGNPQGATGTLFGLISGLSKAAQAQGAASLTIRATSVTADLAKILLRQGFHRIGNTNDYHIVINF
jgi:RHS repeat-associated protein